MKINKKLLKKAQNGCIKSRNRLIEQHHRLIGFTIKHYHYFGPPLEDMIQEGVLGLIEAIQTFDIAKGIAFSTHAIWRIRRYIRIFIRKNTIVRYPIYKSILFLETQKLPKEIGTKSNYFNELEYEDMKEQLNKKINLLKPKYIKVIKSRFALEEKQEKTLLEIGKKLNISKERVRQIEEISLTKLGKILNEDWDTYESH